MERKRKRPRIKELISESRSQYRNECNPFAAIAFRPPSVRQLRKNGFLSPAHIAAIRNQKAQEAVMNPNVQELIKTGAWSSIQLSIENQGKKANEKLNLTNLLDHIYQHVQKNLDKIPTIKNKIKDNITEYEKEACANITNKNIPPSLLALFLNHAELRSLHATKKRDNPTYFKLSEPPHVLHPKRRRFP